MKEYKIYRYAYKDTVDSIFVPDETVFFMTYSFNNPKQTEHGEVVQNRYLAVVDYNKENVKILKHKKQSLNLDVFYLPNKYIFIVLDNVYPLSEDFPLTNTSPSIETTYFVTRAKSQVPDSSESLTDIINKMKGMSEVDRKNYIHPIIYYQKVNGFDKYDYEQLDVTTIVVGSWLNKKEQLRIERDNVRITDVLQNSTFIVNDVSDEQEFNDAFKRVVSLM